MSEQKRLVWDIPLRLFHWLLVFSIAGSYYSAQPGSPIMQWHLWLGYWTIGLVLFRIIWGLVGPRHARFSHFLPTPGRLFAYIRGIFDGTGGQTVGHNPLGSLMVIVMLILVGVQAGTGMFATEDIIWTGPYFPAVSSDMADKLTGWHHLNFDFIMVVVGVHIAAILFYLLVKKQNLVRPMITGKKDAAVVPESEEIKSSQLLKAVVVIAICALAVYLILHFAPPPAEEYYY
ncbi:MAG: cytochrome b/b6 domain-containing protein [Gammaproteobacteria bacterium]|nr:cytochrome b/b6 domain-containing protein [Gammaproteobacteria bacterium]